MQHHGDPNQMQSGRFRVGSFLAMAVLMFILGPLPGACREDAPVGADETVRYLKSLSLEDLAELEVTSVSKKPGKLADAPAAVFVITGQDIRRSGATSIPEALRMAPGVHVARVNTHAWTITTRGFNSLFSNKLLVMIDGRTVYSPMYSGVYWRARDVFLEDVDRIEVIRGPGASLWGANAVNGVINIITKSSRETLGGLIAAAAGTEQRLYGGVRYGTRVGEAAHVRAYARYFDRDEGGDWRGIEANDYWRSFRAGFRGDWEPTSVDSLTVQGDVFDVDSGVVLNNPTLTPPYAELSREEGALDGGNILARWRRTLPAWGELTLQMYYDRNTLKDPLVEEVRDTLDVDIQHGAAPGGRHDLLWGLEYRWTRDELTEYGAVAFHPPARTLELISLFIQDRITLLENQLWLILGARFDNGYYTDWETQPTGRLLWKPREAHTFWAAVSGAVRTPSRSERDARIASFVIPPGTPENPSPLPNLIRMTGGDSFESETLTAFEVGHRFQPSERLFVDLAFFYNEYRDLFSTEFSDAPTPDPGPPPFLETTMDLVNKGTAQTWGMEAAIDVLLTDWHRLHLAYTGFNANHSNTGLEIDGSSPAHQVSLRSSMDLPHDLELELWPRYVDELSALDVDGYFAMDVRLGWRPSENLELSLAAQNLFRKERPEHRDQFSTTLPTAVERGVYGKVVWKF